MNVSSSHAVAQQTLRALSVCSAVVAASQVLGGAAQIVNLGVLPGGNASLGNAINADGTVVAGFSRVNTSVGRAIRWTPAGGLQNLGSIGGSNGSAAYGISSDGSVIAGWTSTASPTRAFRWTAGTGMQDLGALPGGSSSTGTGISADGRVVVGISSSTLGSFAFRWVIPGPMQNLGTLPGGSTSQAYGASADGSVVAGYSAASNGAFAFRWTQSTGMQSLGLMLGGTYSQANAISGDGNVIVGYGDVAGAVRAFRRTSGGAMQNLGVLPGGTMTRANAVSLNGKVVGGIGSTPTGNHAFIWTAALGLVDLNTYLPTLGVNLSGWTLEEALGLSQDGSAITGYGTYSGTSRGFVVTGVALPERVNGHLALQGYTGPTTGYPLEIQVWKNGTLAESMDGGYQANGAFAFSPSTSGDVILKFRFRSSLWKGVAVTLGASPILNLSVSLTNGDCDRDNVVSVFDYILLSDAFDATPMDANWNSNADLDGDEVVSIFDYIILSDSFDVEGD